MESQKDCDDNSKTKCLDIIYNYEKLKRKMWDLNPCPHDGTVSSNKSNALPTELLQLLIFSYLKSWLWYKCIQNIDEKLKRKLWYLNPCPHDGTISSTKSNALPTELFRLTIIQHMIE